MESKEDSRDDSKENSNLAIKIILGVDGLAGIVGSVISYKIFKTAESAGYGFLAGSAVATLAGITYVSFRDYYRK